MRETHTPGPWVVGPYHSELPDFAVGLSKWEDGTACGCSALGNDYLLLTSYELTEANARLIASAPDLLHALQMMLGCELMGGDHREGIGPDEPGTSPVAKARAAIAKATGKDVTP